MTSTKIRLIVAVRDGDTGPSPPEHVKAQTTSSELQRFSEKLALSSWKTMATSLDRMRTYLQSVH